MFGKKEIYQGIKNDKYYNVLNTLKESQIKFSIRSNDTAHIMDIPRGSAVGRYGESAGNANAIYSIYVQSRDYDKAVYLLKEK